MGILGNGSTTELSEMFVIDLRTASDLWAGFGTESWEIISAKSSSSNSS